MFSDFQVVLVVAPLPPAMVHQLPHRPATEHQLQLRRPAMVHPPTVTVLVEEMERLPATSHLLLATEPP